MKAGIVALFALASFLASALLFAVQPMIGKMVLPLFGGTPAVWNTCLVFFQGALLAGYLGSYGVLRTGPTVPARISGFYLLGITALLAAAYWMQPIEVQAGNLRPFSDDGNPALLLLGVLGGAATLPLVMVSATAPLVQGWFARTGHPRAGDPYFLYSASNAGSLLALLAYPFFIEPHFGLTAQSHLWKAGFLGLALLVVACGAAARQGNRFKCLSGRPADCLDVDANEGDTDALSGLCVPTPPAPPSQGGERETSRATRARGWQWPLKSKKHGLFIRPAGPSPAPVPWLSWLILVFIPSSWLMGVTAYLTTDLASIPLMWIIPLALYLVSFILAFDARGAKIVRAAARSLPYLIAPLALVMIAGFVHLLWVPLHLITFFAGCLACHGALAGMRPPPLQLASFYLSIALGGLVGGTWSAIVAPLIFDRVVEYPLALVLAALVIPGARARELTRHWHELSRDLVFAAIVFSLTALLATNSSGLGDSALGVLGVTIASGMGILSCVRVERRPLRFALVIAAILTAGALAPGVNGRLLHIERNFFGVLRVTHDSGQNVNRLFHGSTLHGQQSLGPLLRREPSTYFTRSGPIGQVFRAVQERLSVPHARVAIVGLGAGTLASYAQPGQRWSFYELDPAVERIARDPRFFTYLRDCQARSVDVILGDARRRLRDAADRAYLLIVLDAFSSDALPVHLLSREAIRLYRSKLAPGGLLLFNLSNRYLDLDPVIGRQAVDAGLVCRVCYDVRVSDDEKRAGKQPSIWALLAADETDLGTLSADPRWQPPALRPGSAVWTDDYSDLASYLLLTPGARRGHDRPATVSPGRE